jgi:hypothetical protein
MIVASNNLYIFVSLKAHTMDFNIQSDYLLVMALFKSA